MLQNSTFPILSVKQMNTILGKVYLINNKILSRKLISTTFFSESDRSHKFYKSIIVKRQLKCLFYYFSFNFCFFSRISACYFINYKIWKKKKKASSDQKKKQDGMKIIPLFNATLKNFFKKHLFPDHVFNLLVLLKKFLSIELERDWSRRKS